MSHWSRIVITLLLLGLACFAAGRLGLILPASGPNSTLIWLPTGIAVAALTGFLLIQRDIGKRRAVEGALRESEERYRQIVDAAEEGIWSIDTQEKISFVNPTMARMLGYTTEEILGRGLYDFMDDEARAEAIEYVKRRKMGITEKFDFRLRRKDGSALWTMVSTNPILDAGGAYVGALAMITDITERKQAEDALRESELRLRLTVKAADVGLWDWDLQANTVYYSPEWKRQLGYGDEEISNRFDEWQRRVHPQDLDPALRKVRAYLENPRGQYEVEFRLRHKDGRYRWIYSQSDLLRDASGKPVRMLGSHIDITHRKQAEQALRESEARYRLLFEANPHPMWVFDLESLHFLAVNNAAIAHYGYSREEFLAMTIKDIRPPEDVPALLADVAAVGTGLSEPSVWRHCKRDGTLIDVEINSHAIDFGGHRAEVVLAHDITERRRMEARLLQAEDAERRRIAKELHDSTAQDLVAAIMNLGALQESIALGSPDIARSLEDTIALVENSVNDIRTLSYLLHPPRLDETGLAGALTEYAAGFTARTDTRIRVDIPADFGRLPADMEIVLFRIVQEGIANVLRHAQSDAATIRVNRKSGNVVLEVEDYGRGMAEASTRGVGIAGMRERLQQLGGRLEMDSDSDGTIVRAVLPLREKRT